MRPLENEPTQKELETIQVDEKLTFVTLTDAPDDVKSEVLERIERFEESDLDREAPEGPPPR